MDKFCPRCNTLLRIVNGKYVMRGDKLYMIQELACRNSTCENNDKVIDKVEHELPVTIETSN